MKIAQASIALALAGFAIPALAGNGWPQGPSSPATKARSTATAPAPVRTSSTAAPGNFTYRGDGIGWEITPHKYVFSGGRLVHSDECDHAIRTAQAITPEIIEEGRKLWPGG